MRLLGAVSYAIGLQSAILATLVADASNALPIPFTPLNDDGTEREPDACERDIERCKRYVQMFIIFNIFLAIVLYIIMRNLGSVRILENEQERAVAAYMAKWLQASPRINETFTAGSGLLSDATGQSLGIDFAYHSDNLSFAQLDFDIPDTEIAQLLTPTDDYTVSGADTAGQVLAKIEALLDRAPASAICSVVGLARDKSASMESVSDLTDADVQVLNELGVSLNRLRRGGFVEFSAADDQLWHLAKAVAVKLWRTLRSC